MIFSEDFQNKSFTDLLFAGDWYTVEAEYIYKGTDSDYPGARYYFVGIIGDDFRGQPANLEIRACLSDKQIPATNMHTCKLIKLDGSVFQHEFNYGYDKGREYFDKHFSISLDTLYQKSENYVSSLYYHFHEVEIEDIYDGHGWNSIVSQKHRLLYPGVFRTHGFYSALIDRVKDLAIRHPTLFLDFFIKRTIAPANEIKPSELSPKRKEINDYFENAKEKYFDETAYDLFATMTTDYFEGREVRVPEVLIAMTNGTKTAFAQQMGIVYKKLSKPKCHMRNNEEFFKILKSIDQFEGETSNQIYAALKR